MLSVFKVCVAIVIILLLYFLWSRRKFYKVYSKLPGPLGYPFLGVILKICNREEVLYTLDSFESDYGKTFVSWLGPQPFLVVAEPNILEKILTSSQLIDKADLYKVIEECVGDGLFSNTSTKWKHHRKHINPAFTHKVLLNFFPIFNYEVNKLNNRLSKLVGKDELDLTEMIQACTINIAAQTTMGKAMTDVDGGNAELLHCFQYNLEIIITKIISPWKQNETIFKLSSEYKKYQMAKKAMNDFVKKLISEKVEALNNNKKLENSVIESNEDSVSISKSKNIFIDHAIDLVRTGEFTWKDVEDEANVIVFGAFETTANTIGNILICLAMFPQYQEKVFEEILSVLPDEDFEVQYEDIQKLVYMEMVINESMRLLAPVPLVARTVMSDVVLFNDILLPKGLQVAIDIFNMQRNETIWGPNAKTFNPDHFLPENLATKHPYAFIPFTKGTRVCIGMKYGMMTIKSSLSKILRKYRFSTTSKLDDLTFIEDITLKFKQVPKLKVHSRTC